jgi:hypothetical protein
MARRTLHDRGFFHPRSSFHEFGYIERPLPTAMNASRKSRDVVAFQAKRRLFERKPALPAH